MLRSVTRISLLSRAAALAVALVLSGAGRLVVEASEQGHHRCACPRGLHDCECPACLAAARRSADAEARRAPPCHGGAVASKASEHRRAPESAVPCLRSSCGRGEAGHLALPLTDTFVAPAVAALGFTGRATTVAVSPGHPLDAPAIPAIPPPRA